MNLYRLFINIYAPDKRPRSLGLVDRNEKSKYIELNQNILQ